MCVVLPSDVDRTVPDWEMWGWEKSDGVMLLYKLLISAEVSKLAVVI